MFRLGRPGKSGARERGAVGGAARRVRVGFRQCGVATADSLRVHVPPRQRKIILVPHSVNRPGRWACVTFDLLAFAGSPVSLANLIGVR
jgi:hypothetical protein